MKEVIAKKWIKALRSGKYEQTKKVLHDDIGFCCLGVLCDLMPGLKWSKEEKTNLLNNGYEVEGRIEGDDPGLSVLPDKVMEWAHFVHMSSDGSSQYLKTALSTMNDHGKSFKHIAKVIEKHWRNL